MDILFISLIILMLLLIIGGTVAWSCLVYRKACRAAVKAEALVDAQEWLSRKMGELDTELHEFLAEMQENAAQEATEDNKAQQAQRSFDEMMKWMPEDIGLKLGGNVGGNE